MTLTLPPIRNFCLNVGVGFSARRHLLASVLGLRSFSELFTELLNAVSANPGIPLSLKSRGHALVGPLPAKTAPHSGKVFFKKTFGVDFSELRLPPASNGTRVDAFCSLLCGLNAVVTGDTQRLPVAIAVIEHELRRVFVLTDCQTRDPAYFYAIPKHEPMARIESNRVIQNRVVEQESVIHHDDWRRWGSWLLHAASIPER